MNAEPSTALLDGDPHAIQTADRRELLKLLKHYRQMGNELIRRAVIEHDRIDLLATLVLGYQVRPFHLALMRFQFQHPKSLQLAYRGSGKTTVCTVTKAIHYLLKNPNFRVLLASKDIGNCKDFLREIKAHFENNERLIEIFGVYYDPHKVAKWDETRIEVAPRTIIAKEPSICCASPDSGLTSRHVDAILCDDLVVEENCRTKHGRDRTKKWFYQTLDPCLEPPDSEVPHRGERHILGTRYHYDDFYGHLIEKEMKEHHQIIEGPDEKGRVPWPEKHPLEWFEEKKQTYGVIIYNSQYMNDTEAMKGEVFDYDDCQVIEDNKIPEDLRVYMGTDLAVSEKDKKLNAQFAIVVIGIDTADNVYVLDFVLQHLTFPAQIKRSTKMHDKHDPIRAAVEANAYQLAFVQYVRELDKDYRFVPVYTDKDKMTRALKLTPLFESKRVFFRKNQERLIDQFVLFPGYKLKDGLDAFDLAYRISKKKRRKRRTRREPLGLI